MRKVKVTINVVNWSLEALSLCFIALIGLTAFLALTPELYFVGLIGFGMSVLVRYTWEKIVIAILSILNWADEKWEAYKEYQERKLSRY